MKIAGKIMFVIWVLGFPAFSLPMPGEHYTDPYCAQELATGLRAQLHQRLKLALAYPFRKTRSHFLSDLDPQRETWRKMVLWNPESLPEKNYLQNLYDSLADDFEPWFLFGKDSEYDRTLMNQYYTLASGRLGSKPYHGISHRRPLAETLYFNRWPGNIRDSLYRLIFPFLIPEGTPMAHTIRTRYAVLTSVPIEGIDSLAWPKISSGKAECHVHFPAARFTIHYLERMRFLMNRIRREARPPRLIQDLADYFQLGVFAHYFSIGNTSLYLAQVNYVLANKGLGYIPPAFLDREAYINPTESFRQIFYERIVLP